MTGSVQEVVVVGVVLVGVGVGVVEGVVDGVVVGVVVGVSVGVVRVGLVGIGGRGGNSFMQGIGIGGKKMPILIFKTSSRVESFGMSIATFKEVFIW